MNISETCEWSGYVSNYQRVKEYIRNVKKTTSKETAKACQMHNSTASTYLHKLWLQQEVNRVMGPSKTWIYTLIVN